MTSNMLLVQSIVGIFVIFLATYSVHAQVASAGRCPNVTVQENFELDNYLGKWYEFSKYPFIFEAGGKCVYAIYNKTDDNNVSVYNSNINIFTNRVSSISGKATVVGSGKLSVTFPTSPFAANYWVLKTDYTNYAVVYSCTNILMALNLKVVWILTREKVPSDDIVQQARNIIKTNNLSLRPLMTTDQSCADY